MLCVERAGFSLNPDTVEIVYGCTVVRQNVQFCLEYSIKYHHHIDTYAALTSTTIILYITHQRYACVSTNTAHQPAIAARSARSDWCGRSVAGGLLA